MRDILQIDWESSLTELEAENNSLEIVQSSPTALFLEISGIHLEIEFQAEPQVDLASHRETHWYCHTLFLQGYSSEKLRPW